jgi:hypothetical protein
MCHSDGGGRCASPDAVDALDFDPLVRLRLRGRRRRRFVRLRTVRKVGKFGRRSVIVVLEIRLKI